MSIQAPAVVFEVEKMEAPELRTLVLHLCGVAHVMAVTDNEFVSRLTKSASEWPATSRDNAKALVDQWTGVKTELVHAAGDQIRKIVGGAVVPPAPIN